MKLSTASISPAFPRHFRRICRFFGVFGVCFRGFGDFFVFFAEFSGLGLFKSFLPDFFKFWSLFEHFDQIAWQRVSYNVLIFFVSQDLFVNFSKN